MDRWKNCTLLIESGAFPQQSAICDYEDNFALWFISAISIVYCTTFLAFLGLQLKSMRDQLNWRAKVTIFVLAGSVLCVLVEAISSFVWLLGVLPQHPWDTKLGYINVLDPTLFLCVISLKGSSFAHILKNYSKARKITRVGLLEWTSIFMAVVEPVLLTVCLVVLSLNELWSIFIFQALAAVSLNTLLIIGIVCLMVRSTLPFRRYKHAALEIFALQVLALCDIALEYYNQYRGKRIPLSGWLIFQTFKTLPAFIVLWMLLFPAANKMTRQSSVSFPRSTPECTIIEVKSKVSKDVENPSC
mmetsp:Transcript_17398/g.28074  ORF Transcript_17398/g.28074 Transcript_17398/m.28074 type:complete len:302 (+) Transcript_17398:383-1288(+)